LHDFCSTIQTIWWFVVSTFSYMAYVYVSCVNFSETNVLNNGHRYWTDGT
jgi:hypothetical protein